MRQALRLSAASTRAICARGAGSQKRDGLLCLWPLRPDPMFDLFGVTLAVISTIARAGKSVLQQKLMSSDEERLSPISLTR